MLKAESPESWCVGMKAGLVEIGLEGCHSSVVGSGALHPG